MGLVLGCGPLNAQGQSAGESGNEDTAPSSAGWRGRIELKREDANRATPEEATKTFLRVDTYLRSGTLSFQLPFPDDMNAEGSGRYNPKLGDFKSRFRFAPFPAGAFTMSFFLEATFPTADPGNLGTGKYQVSEGWTSTLPFHHRWSVIHQCTGTAQVQQVNSVGGDPERTDINYTKLDLSAKDAWEVHWVKAAVNLRADWIQDGRTGAVGELEYGYVIHPAWKVWVMAGGLLWGEGVKGTYGKKIALSLSRTF